MDQILKGDCSELLPTFPDNHFHAVVTDPPYALTNRVIDGARCSSCSWEGTGKERFLTGPCPKCGAPLSRERNCRGKGFMGKEWDNGEVAFDPVFWYEVLRVLRPGGYLLAFGGSRTYHRMAGAIEDAGFIVHPMIAWVQGQGFPKATNLSKMLDKDNGAEREVIGKSSRHGGGTLSGAGWNIPAEIPNITAPASPEAIQWDGWYYGRQSLKPAIEPIMMAQKPPDGRMVDNIRKWGCGAVNVDGCRIAPTGESLRGGASDGSSYNKCHEGWDRPWKNDPELQKAAKIRSNANQDKAEHLGRWPANLIMEAGEPVKLLDEQSGSSGSNARKNKGGINLGYHGGGTKETGWDIQDSGTASRFFLQIEPDPFVYVAKASPSERNGSKHPTMKPLKLMRYLCRLVTPPGGLILDPFAGSGTTILAARQEGFDAIGIEQSPEYCEIAINRISAPYQERITAV